MEITDWSYAKYIVVSSFFFQIPALYAYHHHIYHLAGSCCMTTLLSINHWRHPTYTSWRRRIDVGWVRMVLLFYFVHYFRYGYIGIPIISMMIGTYYKACVEYDNNALGNWYLYHMLFHAISSMNIVLLIKLTYVDVL